MWGKLSNDTRERVITISVGLACLALTIAFIIGVGAVLP